MTLKTNKMKLPFLGIAFILAAFAGFTSCTSEDESGSNERRNVKLTSTTRAASDDLKDFYFQITRDALEYESQAQTDAKGNVVISPLSAAMTLSMIACGIDEVSSKRITDYLGVPDLSALKDLSQTLLEFLPTADKRTQLGLANALWVNDSKKLNPNVASLLQYYYNSEIFYGDFANNGGTITGDINKWCVKNTGNQIISYPGSNVELDDSSILLCLNALNFAGEWTTDYFDKSKTSTGVFHGAAADSNVDFMKSSRRNIIYGENENFQMAKLFFGNETFYIELWLPAKSLSLAESCALITKNEYDNLDAAGGWYGVEIEMPKFKTNYKVNLGNVFRNSKTFNYSDLVNFTMLENKEEGTVSYNQACAIEIDEDGAKAAAVTAADGYYTDSLGDDHTLRLDRPFYFFIKEINTGACLLSGRVTNL